MLNTHRIITAGFLSLLTWAVPALPAQDYSEAERLLFLNDHLAQFKQPVALRYRYSKKGTLEKPAIDTAVVRIKSTGGTDGKVVKVDYLNGERKLELPETTGTTGNPILLNFLERDTREMKRLTGGSTNYFRKRIRLALADKASVAATSIDFGGKQRAAKKVTIDPYVNDDMRAKIGKFEHKQYSFIVSDHIPGEVYELRTLVMDPANKDQVLMEEVVTFEGVEK
jgi:hypothetical protein